MVLLFRRMFEYPVSSIRLARFHLERLIQGTHQQQAGNSCSKILLEAGEESYGMKENRRSNLVETLLERLRDEKLTWHCWGWECGRLPWMPPSSASGHFPSPKPF